MEPLQRRPRRRRGRLSEQLPEAAPRPKPGSKAGRNEARKLAATFFNNAGIGFFLAGILQPLLNVLRDRQNFGWAELGVAFLLMVIGAMFAGAAQVIARRLED